MKSSRAFSSLRALIDRPWFAPGLLGGFAAVLRGVFLLQLYESPLGMGGTLWWDAGYYLMRGREIAEGNLLGDAAAFLSPGYCGFLGLLGAVLGAIRWPALLIQMAASVGACLLVYALARDFVSRRYAFVSGALLAACPVHIYFTGAVMPTTMVVTLLLGFVLAAARSLNRPGLVRVVGTGVLLGLLVTFKPNNALLLPIYLVLILRARQVAPGLRRRLVSAAAATAAVALVLAPLWITNAYASGRFVPFTTTAGQNLFKGNGPVADGGHVPVRQIRDDGYWLSDYLDHSVDAARAVEVDNRLAVETLDHVKEHPQDTVVVMATKLRRFLSGDPDLPLLHEIDSIVPLLRLPPLGFAVIIALGLAGAFLLVLRRRACSGLIVLTLAAQLVGFVAFFVVTRYRLPFVALLAVPAGFAVSEVSRGLRQRRWREVAVAAVAVVLAAFVVCGSTGESRERGQIVRVNLLLGERYLKLGRPALAIDRYQRALEHAEGEEAVRRATRGLYRAEKRL